ncbi:MAG: hypothetical protein AVDCRST_MAG43-1119 [uncultured Thermomicrobiales bacterium]|uniref:Uncharacterized protein n=1 Tax=uncultured Thermomicrobiales bacterium TaxID=1645740 RepID=A0A6J4UKU8_9BACT|nr:MAG: hypothetical protein AVDCRST_MAG43-1119 [uncultured Thermomicrobiales bacterium]
MDRLDQFKAALSAPSGLQRIVRGQPVLDHAGRPIVVVGDNAFVARIARPDADDIALRIVASDGNAGSGANGTVSDWALRYGALRGLNRASLGRALPAGIEVIRNGPFLSAPAGNGDPVGPEVAIVMEWIEGPTLVQAVDRAARAGKSNVLQALAAAVVDVVNTLGSASFIHGDITASNLIVRSDGRIACVDLDTASWPDSPLGPSGRGTAGYRHPTEYADAAGRDLFALLTIYTSLRILADDPDLRRSYGDPVSANDGVLLFSPWDLLDPGASECFREVDERVDTDTLGLVDALRTACLSPVSSLERHLDLIPRFKRPASLSSRLSGKGGGWNLDTAVDRVKARFAGAAVPNPAEPWKSAVELDQTLVQPSVDARDTDESWTTWETSPLPPRSTIEDVTEDDRGRLLTALDRNNEPEIARLWARLRNDPVSSIQAGRVEAAFAAGYQRRMTDEASRGRDGAVVQLAEEAALRQLPLGSECRKLARTANERLAIRATLDRALAENDREQLAELALSGKLVVLGDTDRPSLHRVLRAIEWPALMRAIDTDDDRLILEAFDPSVFGDMSDLDDAVRDRVRLAERRVAWLAKVRAALRKRHVDDLSKHFTNPPAGGPERLSAPDRRRIRQAIERRAALEELGTVIRGDDDAAIIAALNRVERVGARVSDRFAWGVIQRVVERVSVIDDLIEAAESQPIDYGRLAQLLPVVRALGLTNDPRLEGDFDITRLEAHVVRIAHVRRIRAALSRDNDVAIMVAAVPDPHNALDELSEEERDRVARAILSRRRVDRKSVDARIAS